MKYTEPLDPGEVLSLNVHSTRDWIERNRSSIKSVAKSTVFYGGYLPGAGVHGLAPGADKKDLIATAVWKRPDAMTARLKRYGDGRVPVAFEDLGGILKRTRNYPAIVDRDRIEQKFSNAFECFEWLKGKPAFIPKPELDRCLERMSEVLAQNAQGDIRILVGWSDELKMLGQDRILINKELPTLLKNPKISAESKERLLKALTPFLNHFDRRHTEDIRRLQEEVANFKARR